MYGLHPVDIVAVVVYLAGITALGVWMARKVRDTGTKVLKFLSNK